MSIYEINPIATGAASSVSTQVRLDGAARDPSLQHAGTSFSAWLSGEMEQVNQQILQADAEVRKLAVGEATNLHQVMIALEKAKLSFELAVQVRNKLLEAYQDIIRMQI